MGDLQIKEIAKTRTYTETIRIVAPGGRLYPQPQHFTGQRFDKGYEWYRLADLSRIWILTDTYEQRGKILAGWKSGQESATGNLE